MYSRLASATKLKLLQQHIADKLPQGRIAHAVLEQAVSIIEVRLKNASFCVIQGVLDEPDDVPLASVRRGLADFLQQLDEDPAAPAVAAVPAVHMASHCRQGRLHVRMDGRGQHLLQLQIQRKI
ncbi:hypothetical protein ABZ901_24315 [Actinacidiphila alni]|uniref:hypothetical protein n=1 Tax=Actinacidiphila alni TaxID=380248 RepID=UPI0033C99E4E